MIPQSIDRVVNSYDETVLGVSQQTAKQHIGGPEVTATLPQRNQVKHVPTGSGAANWGPGELMTFLITGEETGGAFFMAEVNVAPGGGTPPHIHHRDDESFHLLEGMLTIQVGGNTIAASAGDFVSFPVESLIRLRTPATAMRRCWS